jgi:hypothetical protein
MTFLQTLTKPNTFAQWPFFLPLDIFVQWKKGQHWEKWSYFAKAIDQDFFFEPPSFLKQTSFYPVKFPWLF